jgi:hypothetical protein
MEFVFMGFQQFQTVRLFSFQCVSDDRTRTGLTIRADLSLARKYDIPLQDLPILCRRFLETVQPGTLMPTMTLTEESMMVISAAAKAAALEKKPVRRNVTSSKVGQAWRSPTP